MKENALRATAKVMPKRILTPTEWAEMHDFLSLALDALGEGPEDVSREFFDNCVLHQRLALRIAHRRLERLQGGEA